MGVEPWRFEPITCSDALPLSHRTLVGAIAIKLGSCDKHPAHCTNLTTGCDKVTTFSAHNLEISRRLNLARNKSILNDQPQLTLLLRLSNSARPLGLLLFPASKQGPYFLIFVTSCLRASTTAYKVSLTNAYMILEKTNNRVQVILRLCSV